MSSLNVSSFRENFPSLESRVDGKRAVYLDSACTALKSRRVADALHELYLNWGGCGGKRSTHRLSQYVEERVTAARRQIAAFINAERLEEIVLTSGTTEGVNLVARAFPYEGERREVVVSDMEHNSVLVPFLDAERRGEAVVRYCPTKNGAVDLDALEGLLGDRTALVAMTRSSNVLGGELPAAQVARMAHRAGAKLLLDDAQFLSSHREDVQASGADFVVFSGHKLGGPFGTGVLYGKEHLLNGLGVYKVGGGTVKDILWEGDRAVPVYLDAPMRFEAGVQNLFGAVGLAEAVGFLESWPANAVRAHVASLVRHALERLKKIDAVEVVGDPEHLLKGSLVSFRSKHPNFSEKDFSLYLNHEMPEVFFAVRSGEHCAHLLHRKLGIPSTMRMSFFAYNTTGEIDEFVQAMESYAGEACV